MDACPDISADWLLKGEGSMEKNVSITGTNGNVTGNHATVIGQQSTLSESFVNKLLAEKDRQIDALLKLLAK